MTCVKSFGSFVLWSKYINLHWSLSPEETFIGTDIFSFGCSLEMLYHVYITKEVHHIEVSECSIELLMMNNAKEQ